MVFTQLLPANLKYLILTDNTRIWTPDIFIQNEKDSELHKLMNPNTFIRIFPDGHVLYSARSVDLGDLNSIT